MKSQRTHAARPPEDVISPPPAAGGQAFVSALNRWTSAVNSARGKKHPRRMIIMMKKFLFWGERHARVVTSAKKAG
jgi:hypothetical protein